MKIIYFKDEDPDNVYLVLEELENRSLNKLEPYIEQLSKSSKNLVDESWENN